HGRIRGIAELLEVGRRHVARAGERPCADEAARIEVVAFVPPVVRDLVAAMGLDHRDERTAERDRLAPGVAASELLLGHEIPLFDGPGGMLPSTLASTRSELRGATQLHGGRADEPSARFIGPIPPRGPEAETACREALTPGGLSRRRLRGFVRLSFALF